MSVIAGKEFPVRDCGKKRPQIRRVMQSGHVLYDRPPVVPHLCAIDPAGFIVDIPLHNGGANAAPDNCLGKRRLPGVLLSRNPG